MVSLKANVKAVVKYRVIKRRVDEKKPYAIEESEHQCYLVEGMNEMWSLICGDVSAVAYNNANARIGVGNGTAAEDETQTGLQGTSTAFKAMESSYPTYGSNKKATFRSKFVSGEAEFAWEEVTIDNGSTRNKNMLRIVSSKGTKPSGEEWTAEIECTFQNPA